MRQVRAWVIWIHCQFQTSQTRKIYRIYAFRIYDVKIQIFLIKQNFVPMVRFELTRLKASVSKTDMATITSHRHDGYKGFEPISLHS